MNLIVIAGSSGFIGSELVTRLRARGDRVVRLVRRPVQDSDESEWNPSDGKLDSDLISGADSVINLAGASIAGGRWTRRRKALLRSSRVDSTHLLASAMSGGDRPRVFVSASAVGVYGDRGDEKLTENSAPGLGFLAKTAREWEAAADRARESGVRVVHPRTAMVLDKAGGALAKMLLPFKLGLGGRLGSGRQFVSWITLHDCLRALERVLDDPEIEGPVNFCAPQPVTNAEFTAQLGSALKRPTFLPVPGWAINLLLGEMGKELLLSSQKQFPERLLSHGFGFEHPDLATAFSQIL